MNVTKGLVTLLKTDPAISAINAERVYPEVAPQTIEGTALVYTITSSTPVWTMCGSKQPCETQAQIDCWGCSYAEAQLLANATESALDWYTGVFSGVQVDRIFVTGRQDGFEKSELEYRVLLTISIHHER